MASINFNNLFSNFTTDNTIRRIEKINPNNFTNTVWQISDQQSRDKNYSQNIEYLLTYVASIQAKIAALTEELNGLYELTLSETLFKRADSKNTAKKLNKLVNATSANEAGQPGSIKIADNMDPDPNKTDIVPTGYDGETRQFQYNPFFGSRSADLSNYSNLTADNTVSTARAYYQTSDNMHHELGASALGALSYLWLWDVDRINASYATTMDQYIDASGNLHTSPNDRSMTIVDPNSGNPLVPVSERYQVNITALQPNRGLADINGVDAPQKIIPLTGLSNWSGYQAGDITYTNGQGYSFTAPQGNQLFFDTEKWAVVDINGVEPTMNVLTSVTREFINLENFGRPGFAGYGGDWANDATMFGNWVNRTNETLRYYDGGQDGYWKNANGGEIYITNNTSFNNQPLHAPAGAPQEQAYAQGTLFADDGWALYIENTSDAGSYTYTGLGAGGAPPPVTSSAGYRISYAGGYTTTAFSVSGNVGNLDKNVTILALGKDGGWAGGGPSRSGLAGWNLQIGTRTVTESPTSVPRYFVDENGNIIDRFGTGSNGSYGHFNGSSQVSNNPNPAPVNNTANGYDDYSLFDYVPNTTPGQGLNVANALADTSAGDFYYYRENLNADSSVVNNNRPNITFDPRGSNLKGMISVSNDRVTLANTDFAMFGNTILTYVEQNQDVYNQTKRDSFATWIGETDLDLVSNNDSTPNTEKDYKMTLNFENKDENGIGILSAVRRVHVKIEGEPTIQDPEVDEWDSVTWEKRTVLDRQINPWSYDTSTSGVVGNDWQSGDPEISISTSADFASFDVSSISTLVTPGYWTSNGSTSVYVNQPWVNQQVFTPSLDVYPDRLTSISGTFVIDNNSSNDTAGNLKVGIEYSNDGGATWSVIPGSEQCWHTPCSGNHSWTGLTDHPGSNISDGLQFNLPAPPAQDGVTQIRVSGTVNGIPITTANTNDGKGLFGRLTLQADKERYIDPVYADKSFTKDIFGTGANLTNYRNAKVIINNNTQNPVEGADIERVIQYRNNGGTWTDLIVNPPAGTISADLPASANGNVDIRAVVRVHARANPIPTQAISDIWNISNIVIHAEPIPDEPKTLGLEMTKGFYKGVEQTGGGGIINPLSSLEAGYTPAYASEQNGVQNFHTDINGVASFNMYLNKDEYDTKRKKNPVVNDSTVQVTVEYVEDTNQNGRIDNGEENNIKTKIIGVDDAVRNQMSTGATANKRLSDVDPNHAYTVFNNTLNVGKGRAGGADEKTGNENKFTKRLKQIIDSQEYQEVLKYGLLDNIFIAATSSDNRGDQITGKLLLNWDWRRRKVEVQQLFFSAIYKA